MESAKRNETKIRRRFALYLRRQSYTYEEIGKFFRVSTSRAYELVAAGKKQILSDIWETDLAHEKAIELTGQIFHGLPLLVRYQKEIEHLFEDMNERHHRLRNAVHESGTSTEEAARRDVGTGLQRGTNTSDSRNR